ncbi:MAG: transposase, partial [Nanoarchaeota archaeon]|nr:transposase [Nanoarchaeota archaeon]
MDSDINIVTYDQAHFNIDADVRRCWSFIGETPIVYKNGSKKAINIGGAYSDNGKFVFYQMEKQVKETILENMKLLHRRFPKMFILLD